MEAKEAARLKEERAVLRKELRLEIQRELKTEQSEQNQGLLAELGRVREENDELVMKLAAALRRLYSERSSTQRVAASIGSRQPLQSLVSTKWETLVCTPSPLRTSAVGSNSFKCRRRLSLGSVISSSIIPGIRAVSAGGVAEPGVGAQDRADPGARAVQH